MIQTPQPRSAHKFPTNPLCVRAFARELKTELIGEAGTKPQFPLVDEAFFSRTGAELGKATWSEWWKGRRVPNATYRTLIDNKFDGLASKWLYRSLDRGRLQRHLSAFDLGWMHEQGLIDANVSEAWDFLHAVARDWSPRCRGVLYFPNAVSRGVLGDAACAKLVPALSGAIPLRERKGIESRWELLVSGQTVLRFDPLSPASVLSYLLAYAHKTQLPDPALKEAFILDFLTAVNACVCLLQATGPASEDLWGHAGSVASASKDYFWTLDTSPDERHISRRAHFRLRVSRLMGAAGLPSESERTIELLSELKDVYYRSFAVAGGELDEHIEFTQQHSGISCAEATKHERRELGCTGI